MSVIGSLILIAVGVVCRFGFPDPDMPSLYGVGIIFIGCGVAGLLHDAVIARRRMIQPRANTRRR